MPDDPPPAPKDGVPPVPKEGAPPPPSAKGTPAPPAEAPPKPVPKADGEIDAFAKFFKRVGKDNLPDVSSLPPLEPPEKAAPPARSPSPPIVEQAAAKAKGPEPSAESAGPPLPAPGKSKDKEKEKTAASVVTEKTAASIVAANAEEEKDVLGKESAKQPEVWPRRAPAPERPKPVAPPPAKEEPKEEEPKASPKMGFGLPPPGTVTKKTPTEKAAEEAQKESEAKKPAAVPEEEDEEAKVQEVSPLDHRFVGLVIGKAGETIKSFKKQSGASIEIDQNLPDGMPRVVIYRGTKKQVAAAKRLIDGLVLRAKEDEKTKATGAPIGAGMGIMGRGPAGPDEKDLKEPVKEPVVEAKRNSVEEQRKDTELPPWRRTKPGEEEQPRTALTTEVVRRPVVNRNAPWSKREKELEAAPSGSLTGSLTGGASLSMRPAWMKPTKESEEVKDNAPAMLGPFERSRWNENMYAMNLFMQARTKILKSKAYEVPEEMMTMTTGARPKWKPEREEKKEPVEGSKEADPKPQVAAERIGSKEAVAEPRAASPEDEQPEEQVTKELEEVPVPSKKKLPKEAVSVPKGEVAGSSLYENLPGDSKDIMKLKKKLREIQKIEDAINAGKEVVEPNQREKVTKKVGYLDELKQLEAIVRSPMAAGSPSA